MLPPPCDCMYCIRDIGVCIVDFMDPLEYEPKVITEDKLAGWPEDGTEPFQGLGFSIIILYKLYLQATDGIWHVCRTKRHATAIRVAAD